MPRLNSLQAGRAFAAMAVAAFHLSIMMGAPRYGGNAVFSSVTRFGDRGVDYFFVLSGFIILFVHHKDINHPAQLGSYLRKRFTRLFPIYWLYTLPMTALLLMGMGTDASLPTTLPDWLTSITLIRFTPALPPLPTSWTLFHEVAFYATFGLLILNRRLGVAALLAAALACVLHFQFPGTHERTPYNVYTAAYNLYFLFGIGAYWLFRCGGQGWWELLLGIALPVLALSGTVSFDPLSSLLAAIGFALILAGAAKLEQRGAFAVPGTLVFIGDASYTIYLLHLPFEGLLLKMAFKSQLYSTIGAAATYLLTFAGAVLLSCLAYRLVERPLLSYLQSTLNKWKFPLDQVAPSR